MGTTVGIIMMVAGFLGVLVCAKMQKTNPNIQPVAILMALIMLSGLGVYAYNYMSGDDGNMEDGIIYQCSIMDRAGDYLKKKAAGKSVVLVVEPGIASHEAGKKLLDAEVKAFEKAYGSSVEVVEFEVEGLNEEDGGSYADMMKAEDFDKLVAAHESADIFVLTVGLPDGYNVPDFKEKTVFLTNSGMISEKALKRAIEDGVITAVVSGNGKKLDPDFRPDEDDLKGAFNYRWIIVDKDNLDKLR